MTKALRLARPFHWLYATLLGYFWLPCPCCGTRFGGHQWRDRNGLPGEISANPDRPWQITALCPTCTLAGRGTNRRTLAPRGGN